MMANDRSGYVFQDKNGTWYARTTITDPAGKRRNVKRRAKDKRDAKEILKNILRELDAGGSKAIDVARMTFNDLADFYAAHYCKPAEYVDGKKVAGLRDLYRARYCLTRFRAYFGRRRLREITYGDVSSYYGMRLKQHTHYGRPPNVATMNREMGLLRRVFNIGVREGWLLKNPLCAGESLILPALERRRERILTLEEERRVLAACDSPALRYLRPFVICLLDTGARRSEVLKLRWRSVCLAARVITIEGMTTKTLKPRRVTMTERVCAELTALRRAWGGEPDALVFGKLINKRLEWMLGAACAAAGVEYGSPYGITFHSLRHTAATRLMRGQMPLQMVGRILGHSQPQTTYRYLSADGETAAQAAAILETFQQQDGETAEASEAVN